MPYRFPRSSMISPLHTSWAAPRACWSRSRCFPRPPAPPDHQPAIHRPPHVLFLLPGLLPPPTFHLFTMVSLQNFFTELSDLPVLETPSQNLKKLLSTAPLSFAVSGFDDAWLTNSRILDPGGIWASHVDLRPWQQLLNDWMHHLYDKLEEQSATLPQCGLVSCSYFNKENFSKILDTIT